MYKIFLVEDEAPIRENIRETIDWKAAGFEYAGDAQDGEVAVAAIRRIKPDILITDIRMPFLDGLELSHIVRREFPGIKILILSGYDDFSYAREAIRLGVSEYLLKPIIPSELMRAVNKVAFDLDRDMADRRDAGRYESLVSRRETFYNDLLDGKQSPSTIMSEAAELGIQLDSQFYMVCVTRPDPKDFDPSIRQSVKEAVVRSAEKAGAVFVKKPAGEYVTIFCGTDENSVEGEAERALTEAMGEAEKLATRLYVGIGSVTEHPHEISRSLDEAETACNYALFTQAASPCLIRNVRGEAPLPGLELSELLGRAMELMQCGNMNDAGDYARSLMRSAARGAALHYAYIDILMTASKVLSDLDAKPEEIIPGLSFSGDNAFTINTPQELENAVRQICERVIQHRRDHLVNRRRDLAMTAKQFIDQNYADPALSLSKVARTTGVSPTHFSAVFSRELHETFSDYLARVRMTNAMRLLKTTSLSAAEVSEKVGFNDPQYFSRAFKRVAGMSIRTFRNRN